jgi:acyl-coenzyme A thioesterase PaaI-like protein
MTLPDKPKRNFWDFQDNPSTAGLAKRRLAAALRKVAGLAAATEAPEEALGSLAETVEGVAARLGQYPARTFRDAFATCKTEEDFAPFADRSLMTGLSNPLSPPMNLSMKGETAVGRVTFGPAYEGVPGHVHGGMVAAVLDEILGFLAVNNGVGGLTAVLTVRYRAPTPIETELTLEAKVVRTDGRKAFVEARLQAGSVVTAEGEGIFVAVDRERMLAVIDTAKKGLDKG